MATTRKRPEQHPEPGAEAEPELAGRLAELESQLAETRDRHLRLAADFDNFRKRARQEQLDTIQHASGAVLERLLPIVDDLQRVLQHAPEDVDGSWLKGLDLTVQKLETLLAEQGVTTIATVGEPFDPKLHEAIGTVESEEHPEDTVLAELRRGYRQHDRVVRPALVKVARRPLPPAS
jgi:molecular chaperone GrpE